MLLVVYTYQLKKIILKPMPQNKSLVVYFIKRVECSSCHLVERGVLLKIFRLSVHSCFPIPPFVQKSVPCWPSIKVVTDTNCLHKNRSS